MDQKQKRQDTVKRNLDMLATRAKALEKGVLSWGCEISYRGYTITAGYGGLPYKYVHKDYDGTDGRVGYSPTLEGCILDINELIECRNADQAACGVQFIVVDWNDEQSVADFLNDNPKVNAYDRMRIRSLDVGEQCQVSLGLYSVLVVRSR